MNNEAYWKKVEMRSGFMPSITATANYLTDYKYVYTDISLGNGPLSFPGVAPTTVYGLNAQWGLFDGFASSNRLRASMAFERASEKELDWTKFQVAREITLEFYRAITAKNLKAVSEANLKTLEDHLHEVSLFKRHGLSTNYDVLRVEVQVSEAKSELLNATDNIETANGKLGELLGLQSAPEPQGALPELRGDLVDTVNVSGEVARPDLAALNERVEGFRLQKMASSVHWAPRVSLFGNYQYYNNRNDEYDDWHNFRNAYQLGLNLTWNLFEGFSSEAKSRQALEQSVQIAKSLKIAQLKATQDAAVWKRKYKYFYSVFKSRQNDIGKAKESVRLAKEGRRVGSRTNTDLLDAETDLFRAQAGAINAQLGVIEALIRLELSTGQKLYEFK